MKIKKILGLVIKEKNYIKIDNTNISPEDVANIIKERFKL